jgi:CheY-like chemotaxis protein
MVTRPLRVLIVDDSDDDAELMAHALKRGGFRTTWARVATPDRLAAALVPERHWDIIACDSALPSLAMRRIVEATRAALPRVPVLLVSGRFPNELERELALVDGYVSKDRLDDLPIAVKAVLGLV